MYKKTIKKDSSNKEKKTKTCYSLKFHNTKNNELMKMKIAVFKLKITNPIHDDIAIKTFSKQNSLKKILENSILVILKVFNKIHLKGRRYK